MFNYLFTLGREPLLSTAEIKAVFSAFKIKYNIEIEKNNSLIISLEKKLDSEKIMNLLGGTIKISEEIPKNNNAKETIVHYLLKVQPKGKIQFSLSKNNKQLALNIKNELKKMDRNARYIEIKNTASILRNNLVKKQGDITIFHENIYITKAIQPIEEFAQRDYERPGVDSKSGMLPPKLAKIMINLAQIKKDNVLFDAFCGSGTILVEAAVMGYSNLMGSDTSEKAIEDTQENLNWIQEKYKNLKLKTKIFVADATNLNKKIKNNDISAIISEPYMGRPLHGNESDDFLKKQVEELKELYINSFKDFHKVLKNDGIIIFIIPSFLRKHHWLGIDCTKQIEEIGFKIIPFDKEKSLRYWRPGQHLARNIWKFEKMH